MRLGESSEGFRVSSFVLGNSLEASRSSEVGGSEGSLGTHLIRLSLSGFR